MISFDEIELDCCIASCRTFFVSNFGMAHVAPQRSLRKVTFFDYVSNVSHVLCLNMFSNPKRSALIFYRDLYQSQPMSSDLKPFHAFQNDVTTETPAYAEAHI